MIYREVLVGLQPMLFDLSLTNKNTLIDISEPAMWHEYWSEDVFVQQLSLQHLNMDLRYNNNALAELNDCTRGLNVVTFTTLLHLGPKSTTSRTLLHLDPNVIPFRTLLLLGHLTSIFHRYEQEIKVRSTRHNSSLICLRTWPKETFQKRYASWIHRWRISLSIRVHDTLNHCRLDDYLVLIILWWRSQTLGFLRFIPN